MRRLLPPIVFYGLTALMLIVSVVSFIYAISLIGKPFPGFFIYDFPRVGSMGSNTWPGIQAGLKTMDRIITANGEPIRKGSDLLDIVRKTPLETPIDYTIESGKKLLSVAIPTVRFTLLDFLKVFMIPFAGGIAIFILGFIAYLLKPNTSSSWVFFAVCLSLTNYMVTGVEMQSTYRFVNLNYISVPLMPATLFHLGLIFPEKKKILRKYPRLEYLIYLPAILLILAYQVYLFNYSDAKSIAWVADIDTINAVNRVFSFGCVVGLIAVLIHSYLKADSTVSRQRARMVLFGVTIAFLPSAIVTTMVFILSINIPLNFLVFFVIFFPASIAYSIIMHNLFDADAIIKRTVGYVIVTGVVVCAYLLVSVVLNVYMEQYQLAHSRAFPIVFTLVVIFVFNPLRNRIQSLVDRLFFRKEYDYGAIVEKIGNAMTSLLDLDHVLEFLEKTFTRDMYIDTSSIMLLEDNGKSYTVSLAEDSMKEAVKMISFQKDDPLVKVMENDKIELTKYDLIEDPKYKEVSQAGGAIFTALHASLMVPMVFRDEMIGIMNLGEKKSGKMYNREDIELLRAIANQGAVAVENARLLKENIEKQRMEEELSIARDLQLSMLPERCPEIEGFEIAANSVPAREVGGDFYDFIRLGDQKFGFVVGDVTGKSVSGALVMSAARSVMRMLSEEKFSLSEIMVRANRRAKRDMMSGMFIALLYAELNAGDGSLYLCSAGQTQPIHLPAKTGEPLLIETEGDTFPLGIIAEVDYQETRLQILPGDKVIFYTDGIVEAMNTDNEMFGFDRLLERIKKGLNLSAEAAMKDILSAVDGFVGSAHQHDDLTIIVISANK